MRGRGGGVDGGWGIEFGAGGGGIDEGLGVGFGVSGGLGAGRGGVRGFPTGVVRWW